jgi:hypothetical protein
MGQRRLDDGPEVPARCLPGVDLLQGGWQPKGATLGSKRGLEASAMGASASTLGGPTMNEQVSATDERLTHRLQQEWAATLIQERERLHHGLRALVAAQRRLSESQGEESDAGGETAEACHVTDDRVTRELSPAGAALREQVGQGAHEHLAGPVGSPVLAGWRSR